MRDPRRSIALLSMLAALSAVAAPSHAVPLIPGTSLLETELLRGHIEHRKQQQFDVGLGHLADSDSKVFPGGAMWEGAADAVTVGGARPEARASAFGNIDAVLDPRTGNYQGGKAEARSLTILVYIARIAELLEPPVAIPRDALPLTLPITVEVRANVSATANDVGSSALATARAIVAGFLAFDLVAFDSPGCTLITCEGVIGEGKTRNFDFTFFAGQEIGVLLEARAAVVAGAGGDVATGKAEARAVVDPLFSFDQAAFDEIARERGFSTFDLTEYFAFEFSPGFAPGDSAPSTPVSAPSSAALIAAGAVLIVASTRARRAAGRAPRPSWPGRLEARRARDGGGRTSTCSPAASSARVGRIVTRRPSRSSASDTASTG